MDKTIKKTTVIIILGSVLIIAALQSYFRQKRINNDLKPPNRAFVIGTITYIQPARNFVAIGVSFTYNSELYEKEFGVAHSGKFVVGKKVQLMISKLHPGYGYRYIGFVNSTGHVIVDSTSVKD